MLEIREFHPKPMGIPVDEATLSGSQVMNTIGQLVSTLDRNRIARQLVEETECSLMDFCSHQSESFDGRGDHIRVEN